MQTIKNKIRTDAVIFAAVCIITGCGFFEESSSPEKTVFEATSSDAAACKVSGDDFLLVSADLTRISESNVEKLHILLPITQVRNLFLLKIQAVRIFIIFLHFLQK